MRTSQKTQGMITTIGIDIGKNTFHLIGLDKRGAIILQQKVSRSQLERRLANIPRCLIGMEACSGAHHIGRQLIAVGHDVRLMPAQYVKPFLKGHKNDYRDAEAIAEAVQRPTMHFVTIKTPEQMDLLALHRVRSRFVSQRTGVINQIRGFLIERGITVRQGPMPLRKALPEILSADTGVPPFADPPSDHVPNDIVIEMQIECNGVVEAHVLGVQRVSLHHAKAEGDQYVSATPREEPDLIAHSLAELAEKVLG